MAGSFRVFLPSIKPDTIQVTGRDGQLLGEGTIDRVGLDHLDLAVHPRDEQRRGRNVRGLRVIPFDAVHLVRSAQASSV